MGRHWATEMCQGTIDLKENTNTSLLMNSIWLQKQKKTLLLKFLIFKGKEKEVYGMCVDLRKWYLGGNLPIVLEWAFCSTAKVK